MHGSRWIPLAVVVLGLGGCAGRAAPDAWPRQAVRLVVPFGAGTGIDLAARLIAPRLADRWRQPVVVDNRPGTDGVIGTHAFVTARDPHSLLFAPAGGLLVNALRHERLPFDPARDLVPIASAGSPTIVIAAAASLGVHSIAELVALVRGRPGAYLWTAVPGLPELVFGAFAEIETLRMKHAAYRDMGMAVQDLGRGRIHVMVASIGTISPQLDAGRARILAVTTSARAAAAPHVPTAVEAGYPSLTVDGMLGFFGPGDMPEILRRKIAADVREAAADPALVERLAAIGVSVRPGGPEEFASAIERQRAQVATIARILRLGPGSTGGRDVPVR